MCPCYVKYAIIKVVILPVLLFFDHILYFTDLELRDTQRVECGSVNHQALMRGTHCLRTRWPCTYPQRYVQGRLVRRFWARLGLRTRLPGDRPATGYVDFEPGWVYVPGYRDWPGYQASRRNIVYYRLAR